MRFKAFTLAEVLITLGIIGVVAALTISNLVSSYQKKVTVENLKKAYNIFSNAIALAEVDNGSSDTWYFESWDDYNEKYLLPYLKNPKLSNNIYNSRIRSSSNEEYYFIRNDYKDVYCLDNGMCYWYVYSHGFRIENNKPAYTYLAFLVDLNGPKGPNRVGRDIFYFFIDGKKYNLTYYNDSGIDNYRPSRSDLLVGCSKTVTSWGQGSGCTALIIDDGWKISNDYPW